MQRKWMLLISAVVILSFVIAPAGAVQAQADMQTASPGCPPYSPDRLKDKEFVRSLPRDCIESYREMEHQATLAARDAGPAGVSAPETFGYTYGWPDFEWIPGTTNSGLVGDDAFTGPINIGFNFPFYGALQSQLYINTNGLITFGAGSTASSPYHLSHGMNPNNYIAVYWNDMLVGAPHNSGAIYYSQGGSAPNRYFVVEWRNVESYDVEGGLTFEAILYENGDIVLQYQLLPCDYCRFVVVALEGIYGEQSRNFQYGYSGAIAGSAVQFTYPSYEAARVSAHPLQPGKFASPGSPVDFEIMVTNTGTMGTDRYDLTSTNSAWHVAYYAANGSSPLTDTDGDNLVDTGPIAAGSSTRIIARYQTPIHAKEGDDNSAHIQLTSSLNTSIKVSFNLEMTVPGAFVAGFQDEADGAMSFLKAAPENTTLQKVTADGYRGNHPAVARLRNGNYLYAWDVDYRNAQKSWRNIQYAILSPNGTVLLPLTTLVDNSGAAFPTFDHEPAIAAAPDGTVGIVWYRYLYDPATGLYNHTIFFATLNASGTRITGPTNVTNNTVWGTGKDYNTPMFVHPTIAATRDNRFVMSWTNRRIIDSFSYADHIWYAVYNTAGKSVLAPTPLTPSEIMSWNPVLNSLGNTKVILLWLSDSPPGDGIHYTIINSSGEIVMPDSLLTFGDSDYLSTGRHVYDAVLLPNAKVAVARLNDSGVEFAILNSSYKLESGPYRRTHNYYLPGEGLSVTTDESGHIIMTWVLDHHQLAYAVANSNGTFLTYPMIYHTNGDYIHWNGRGQGSAPISPEIMAAFLDVGPDYWAWQFVERLVKAVVTAGCGGDNYCPENAVTRDQMAVFLLKAKHGKSYTPPPAGTSTGFADVPTNHWAAAWIKQLAAEGITGGCGGGNYCPGAPVTRDQMAVFLLKAKYGKTYTPPAMGGSTGFTDVPPDHWAAAWIKQLAAEGITGGCGGGIYCPGNPVNRAEMAVFLVRTFGLP
jgi:hypothetical protein